MTALSPTLAFALAAAAAAGRARRLARRVDIGRRGSTAIEFGVTFPVMILLIVGLIEVAMVLFVNSLMEGGLREAARFGITGFAPNGETRVERILRIVDDHTQGLVDMDQVTIDFLVYPTFNSVGEPEPYTDDNGNGQWDAGEAFTDVNGNAQWDADMGLVGLGGPGDIVLYTLDYQWSMLTGLLAPFMGDDQGRIPLSASIVVRNEPFGTALNTTTGSGT
jgi:Flp pilus assembly protein TadG